LLKENGEYGVRGGTKIGRKWLSVADFDLKKMGFSEKMRIRLVKNLRIMLNYLGVSYVETLNGFHIYILSDELLPNFTFSYQG
jgi:hypothetical protein